MNSRTKQFIFLAVLVCIAGLLAWTLVFAPRNPVALLQVVDGAYKPIAGAVIQPEGLRTKPGPYASGWYGWQPERHDVPNGPVATDSEGYARVPYPKYVFERIETGTLCLSVEHPDYVRERPEIMVAHTPPGGSPWRAWFDYAMARIRHKVLIDRTDPIVLKKGAILKLSARAGFSVPNAALYAQISGQVSPGANFWLHPGPGMLMTRSLAAGSQAIRAIQFESSNVVWFSPTIKIAGVIGQTNELTVNLKPGVTVRGRLVDTVPRPVRNGRVIAHVWPNDEKPDSYPPDWHAWSEIRPDGSFEIASLPEGKLELVAVCDGFVSTNGPGQFPSMHYPQKFSLTANDLDVNLGMEPTGWLKVIVRDDQDKPLQGAQVSCWPNVRYGEWSATIIGQDCQNTADLLRAPSERPLAKAWFNLPFTFAATSDASGLALIGNLPAETREFNVEHPRFALPAVDTGFGQKRREISITLHPPETNRITVKLEPLGQTPITHF